MTVKGLIYKKNNLFSFFPAVFCIAVAVVMIILNNEIKKSIYSGFVFSFTTIIPTLFPFFILSDLWSVCINFRSDSLAAMVFERLFKINGCALSAVISGLVCGFPVGVKGATELYNNKKITKSELERLCGFVNNPSIAFVISGVGAGILRSVSLGVVLYISVILSASAVGILFRDSVNFSKEYDNNSEQKFDLENSIKSAGISSLNVTACIACFSGIVGLLSALIKNPLIITVISPFLEVSNAIKLVSAFNFANRHIRLSLIAFALGFSGFSVHLQAFAFFPNELSRAKYLLMKLVQGVLAALFILLFSLLTK